MRYCKQCGKLNSRPDRQTFCSKLCFGDSIRTIKKLDKCLGCSKSLRNIRNKTYCSYQCFKENHRGQNHHLFKGGFVAKDGYHRITINNTSVLTHRLIMSKHVGRPLKRSEVVHHKDGNKLNNDITNLELLDGQSAHNLLHTIKTFRSKTHRECSLCHSIKPRSDFYKRYYVEKHLDPNTSHCKDCSNK